MNRIAVRTRDERGAAMMIFGVLFAAFVTMGMLAITVDVGAIMLERRHLQNGADATSLALADACAREDAVDCNPFTNGPPFLGPLLDANSSLDEASQLDPSRGDNGQCGRHAPSPMGDCPSAGDPPLDRVATTSSLPECAPLPGWLTGAGANIPYVETYSLTETGDSQIVPKFFAHFLEFAEGADGPNDVSVTACARAAWGAPVSFSATVPVTFSTCEWERATSGGTDYVSDSPTGAWPGYGGSGQPAWPDASSEVVIKLHSPSDETADCSWNGKDTAGGFGYVEEADGSGTCAANVTTDGWVRIDTGNSVSPDCTTAFAGYRGTVVNIPVFDCMLRSHSLPTGPVPTGTDCDPTTNESGGANTYYHIVGWAKFYLSGYKLSGTGVDSVHPSTGVPCSGGDRCLSGWFLEGALRGVTSITAPGGSTDFGTYAVLPAG